MKWVIDRQKHVCWTKERGVCVPCKSDDIRICCNVKISSSKIEIGGYGRWRMKWQRGNSDRRLKEREMREMRER